MWEGLPVTSCMSVVLVRVLPGSSLVMLATMNSLCMLKNSVTATTCNYFAIKHPQKFNNTLLSYGVSKDKKEMNFCAV